MSTETSRRRRRKVIWVAACRYLFTIAVLLALAVPVQPFWVRVVYSALAWAYLCLTTQVLRRDLAAIAGPGRSGQLEIMTGGNLPPVMIIGRLDEGPAAMMVMVSPGLLLADGWRQVILRAITSVADSTGKDPDAAQFGPQRYRFPEDMPGLYAAVERARAEASR